MMPRAAEGSKRMIGWEGFAGDELVTAKERGAVVTIGVFDGLHRGHLRLLAAAERLALSAGLARVHLGFDPHPDLLLRGSTPLRLLDPIEFEMRLAGAGVEHWCDLPFDEAMRDTPWEEFLERVVDLTGAKSFVLSPESAFGRNREGRLDRVRAWGAGRGIQVHPVSEARTGGEKISSTSIRAAITSGELSTAARALGRPHAIVAHALVGGGTSATGALTLEADGFALPPEGEYQLRVGSAAHFTGRLPLTGRLMRGHLDPVAGRLQIAPEGLQRLPEGGGRLRAALLGRLAGRSGR